MKKASDEQTRRKLPAILSIALHFRDSIQHILRYAGMAAKGFAATPRRHPLSAAKTPFRLRLTDE